MLHFSLKLFGIAAAFAALVCSPSQTSAAPSTATTPGVSIREGFTTSPDGVRLYYRVAGSGDQVVIVPFALYFGTSLDRLAVGRRIVTYDPRGRGKSAAVTPDRVTRDLLLTDLDSVRRAVGADKVALIGWSGGGMETFVYALQNPGRVTRIVQLAPVAPRFEPYNAQMMADRRARTDAAARAALNAKILARAFAGKQDARCRAEAAVNRPALFHDQSKLSLVPDVCVYPNEYPETIGDYFGGLFRSIEGFNLLPSLDQVRIPRLVIHPLQDNIPLAGNQEWVRGQANARILTVNGSGHFPHYEQPDVTLTAIETFLSGRWPQGAKRIPR